MSKTSIRLVATEIRQVATNDLIPYKNNARTHSEKQVDQLRRSLREFGFVAPILIDGENHVIAGHGRLMAAKAEGMESVPCVVADGLTEAQRRAYILADNRLAETSTWDTELLKIELTELKNADFDVVATGFDMEIQDDGDWFENRERYDNSGNKGESKGYQDFVEKFEPKRTTDDCYTPDGVYDAVADWVAKEYGVRRENFIRPFYPGGDYQKAQYGADCIVVDNPPFSILSEILRFYREHGVRFFLFCPALTAFGKAALECGTVLAAGVTVTYENGATVSTSFVSNLESEYAARSVPDLFEAVDAANRAALKDKHPEMPKYVFPDEVCTAAMVDIYSKRGVDFRVEKEACVRIADLDAMKETGAAIYGGGLLLSSRAAADRAAATKWELSEREKDIIAKLK